MARQRAARGSERVPAGNRRPDTHRVDEEDSGLSSFDSEHPVGSRSSPPAGQPPMDGQPPATIRTRKVLLVGVALICLVIAGLAIRFGRTNRNALESTATSQPASPPPQPQAASRSPELSRQPAPGPEVRRTPRPPATAADKPTARSRTTSALPAPRAARPPAEARSAPPPPASPIVEPLALSPTSSPALDPVPELPNSVATSGSIRAETLALDAILERYEQAYDRLDANAAASIWSSVDARGLARAFARLQQQDLEFGVCSYALTERYRNRSLSRRAALREASRGHDAKVRASCVDY